VEGNIVALNKGNYFYGPPLLLCKIIQIGREYVLKQT
jgi:hypothetical protein